MSTIYTNDVKRQRVTYYREYIRDLIKEVHKTVDLLEKEFYNLEGDRFGKLIVTGRQDAITLGGGQTLVKPSWACLCDCGNSLLVENEHLTTGWVTDCGECEKQQQQAKGE